MSPHYSKELMSVNSLDLDVLGLLKLNKSLFKCSHGIPSEIGNEVKNTSLFLVETAIPYTENEPSDCFGVSVPQDVVGVVEVSPHVESSTGRFLAESGVGKVVRVQSWVNQGCLETTLMVVKEFQGIQNPGFGTVRVWNDAKESFDEVGENFEKRFEGGIVMVPKFVLSRSGGKSYAELVIIPISEMKEGSRALNQIIEERMVG